jgi:hypothetical protein
MLGRILTKVILNKLSKEGLEKARKDFGDGFEDYFSKAFGRKKG